MAEMARGESSHVWDRGYPSNVDWRAPIETKPVFQVLDETVRRFPDTTAADFMGKTWTYRQLGEFVDRAAKGFQAIGIGKGTKVGLFLPNTPYFVIAYFAALKAGATVVNFNPLYADREIRHQIDDSGTEVMVTLDLKVLYDKLTPMLTGTTLRKIIVAPMAGILPFPKNWLFPLLKHRDRAHGIPRDDRHVRWKDLVGNDGRFRPVDIDLNDVAVLQYTGGTTGTPKGAMLTHANVSANIHQAALWFDGAEEGGETMMGVLPFFHVFAMTVVMLLSVRIAARIVMMPRFDLVECLKLIQQKRATLFPAVPTIYTAINNHPNVSQYDLTSLRFCISGGAALPVEAKSTFETRTGCKLVEGYGLTESSPIACANPLFGVNKPGSIGLPLPGTEVHIISLEDGRTSMPMGERGEVCLRGPQIMTGYLGREDETASTLVDGLLHTGDVGYLDEDGYTFIVDRIKDLIIAGGYNVYPRTVEEAIYLHPAVSEVVVAGLPDPYRGQTVKAYIKLGEGESLTAEDLKVFLKDKLSPIEMPKQIEFRDELPKTMIGKLNRKALVEEEAAKVSS
ncbi:long-chain fatty acid--CoA ligase [Fodinicurvata sp. EGI_FJ10296]|uniref:long-chain-fatty-acid--CoA ligase n=1 Tax=Fodinicurvata sp. EGI_FJ10296 TaxID=3231908 RepID=UPI0034517023